MNGSTLGSASIAVLTSLILIFSANNHAVYGDLVVNSLNAVPGSDTFYETKSVVVGYKIVNSKPASAVAPDPQVDCNAADGTPAFVTISTPPEVSITLPHASPGPNTLGFLKCDGPKPVTFASNVPGDYVITVSVEDHGVGAYTTTKATFTLHVLDDTTPPAITPTITGTTGDNGWYTGDVKVEWNVMDPESNISSTNGCETTDVTSDTAGATITCEATSAGGTDSQSVVIKRDAESPTNIQVVGIEDSYYFGQPIPAFSCTATDATSGVASCQVSTETDNSVGTHTVIATATDNAGNSADSSATFVINPWTINGFLKPVKMDKLNTVEAGSTVPLKFKVYAGGTKLTDASIVDSIVMEQVNCADSSPVADSGQQTLDIFGKKGLKFDDDHFIYNWKVPKSAPAGTCYDITLSTDDGSSIKAHFKTSEHDD